MTECDIRRKIKEGSNENGKKRVPNKKGRRRESREE